MRKKTKQLLVKLGVTMAAIAGSGYFLFGKKKEDKEETIPKINEKKSTDGDLFI